MHIQFDHGKLVLDVNISKNYARFCSPEPQTDFCTYRRLGDQWRVMHIDVAQYTPGLTSRHPSAELGLKKRSLHDFTALYIGMVMYGLRFMELMSNRIRIQKAAAMELRARVDRPIEAQSHGNDDCKCSLCCLTLTSELAADPEMESFQQLALGSRKQFMDTYRLGLVDRDYSWYYSASACNELAALDPASLGFSSGGISGWIQFYGPNGPTLEWPVVDHPESGEVISLQMAGL